MFLSVNAFSQSYMTIHAIKIDNGAWRLCKPEIVAEMTKTRITIYSEQTQRYTVLWVLVQRSIENGDGETSVTWYCSDSRGINCNVTLGVIGSDSRGEYLSVEYSDHSWIYRGYPKR